MVDWGSKRVLVTGGAGMIGSNLVKALVQLGCDVVVVDNLWRGMKSNLLHEGKFVIDMSRAFFEYDLARPGVCDDLLREVNYVYHLADVVAGVEYVFRNQGEVFRQNVLINSNVIDSVRRHPVDGFVYVGTACSFPADKQTGLDAPALCEGDMYPAAPESAYGWSKLMGEYESLLMEKECRIPVAVLTLHNVYGAPTDFGERAQVLPSLVRKAVRHPAESFVVWGSGDQGRAFVHVDDVVQALLSAVDRGLGAGSIQIGPTVCTSIREVAETIVDISGKEINITYDRSKPEGDRGRRADFSKARNVLGWEPRVELRGGLEQLYRWIEGQHP